MFTGFHHREEDTIEYEAPVSRGMNIDVVAKQALECFQSSHSYLFGGISHIRIRRCRRENREKRRRGMVRMRVIARERKRERGDSRVKARARVRQDMRIGRRENRGPHVRTCRRGSATIVDSPSSSGHHSAKGLFLSILTAPAPAPAPAVAVVGESKAVCVVVVVLLVVVVPAIVGSGAAGGGPGADKLRLSEAGCCLPRALTTLPSAKYLAHSFKRCNAWKERGRLLARAKATRQFIKSTKSKISKSN